jgi:hypothetical protein
MNKWTAVSALALFCVGVLAAQAPAGKDLVNLAAYAASLSR